MGRRTTGKIKNKIKIWTNKKERNEYTIAHNGFGVLLRRRQEIAQKTIIKL